MVLPLLKENQILMNVLSITYNHSKHVPQLSQDQSQQQLTLLCSLSMLILV